MEFRRAAVSLFLRTALNTIARIDCREFVDALKKNEPLLVIFNHVNFLEVPILVAYSYPLFVTGIVKSETWNNPFFAFLFNTYKAIPIDRGGAFTESFKRAREAIDKGFYMCISPEGTRSKNGVLQRGRPGIIQLAFEAGVPILPVAHHGGENIWKNIKKLKRTSFSFKAGAPFRIRFNGKPGKEERDEILSEVMGQMAKLLPEEMRGAYAEQAEAECKHLDFIL
ncbi:MAG: 1-acyl-sn-glycerol-3-phosphate acyltransferase [Treponema sp.]|jgi:1-acyl-sn-glycerol-3-phosphate acyltransferase|nr:1-acyl-sn-glycerol-3-phosphate acyltransferase [Treponema sp.]